MASHQDLLRARRGEVPAAIARGGPRMSLRAALVALVGVAVALPHCRSRTPGPPAIEPLPALPSSPPAPAPTATPPTPSATPVAVRVPSAPSLGPALAPPPPSSMALTPAPPVSARETAPRPGSSLGAAAVHPSPLQQAIACHSEPNCVIAALAEVRHPGLQELEMLVAGYRAVDNRPAALSTMRVYLRRYPNGPRILAYHRSLEGH